MIHGKRIVSLIMTCALCIGIAGTAHASEIDETKKKAEELQQQKNAAESEKNSLASQLNQLITQMEDTKAQIETKENELGQKEEELFAAQAQENTQYECMKKRIKFMYENGNAKFIEILVGSRSIGEFLNNAEYISTITEYDRNQLMEYQSIREQVEEQKASLESEYANLETMQNDLISQQAKVEKLMKDKESEIAGISSELSATKEKIAQLEAAAAEAERKKKEAEAAAAAAAAREEAARAAAANKKSTSGSADTPTVVAPVVKGNGTFTHPCPGYSRISSTFGYRNAPLAGASTNHKGVDFAASKGTPIYAAASGTVTTARYSGKAGNLIIISHGNGLLTYYMHCDSIAVSEGQSVSKGQNIGRVGTTGNSTGPHLHFQVMQNGSPVNPMNYL